MYQVTIEWGGAEIGYGEGESRQYAISEAIASVGSFYNPVRREWKVIARKAAL
jgi:hypothetical protein